MSDEQSFRTCENTRPCFVPSILTKSEHPESKKNMANPCPRCKPAECLRLGESGSWHEGKHLWTIRPCYVGSQSSLRQSLFLRSMNSKMPLAEVRPKFAKRASRRGQRAVEILKSCVGRIRVRFDHESKLAMTPAAKVLPRERASDGRILLVAIFDGGGLSKESRLMQAMFSRSRPHPEL